MQALFLFIIFASMFERLIQLCDNTIKLNEGEILFEIMQDNSIIEFTLDLNRLEQLFVNSIGADNRKLSKYSRNTEDMSFKMSYSYKGETRRKTRGDNMFLFDEGDFFNSFRLIANKDGFIIQANTDKEGKDLQIYGDIIGLTEQSKYELGQKIIPNIIELVKGKILSGN